MPYVVVGLVLSRIGRTQFQAMRLGLFTMLPSILLRGVMFPFEGMPVAVQRIAQVLPHVLALALAALRLRKRLE